MQIDCSPMMHGPSTFSLSLSSICQFEWFLEKLQTFAPLERKGDQRTCTTHSANICVGRKKSWLMSSLIFAVHLIRLESLGSGIYSFHASFPSTHRRMSPISCNKISLIFCILLSVFLFTVWCSDPSFGKYSQRTKKVSQKHLWHWIKSMHRR